MWLYNHFPHLVRFVQYYDSLRKHTVPTTQVVNFSTYAWPMHLSAVERELAAMTSDDRMITRNRKSGKQLNTVLKNYPNVKGFITTLNKIRKTNNAAVRY